MVPLTLRNPRNIYDVLNPLLILSRTAAVCTVVRSKDRKQLVPSKFMVVIQTAILIISIMHLAFIPYAVIYIEQLPELSSGNTTDVSGSLSSQKFITKMTNIILISVSAIMARSSSLLQMHKYLPPLVNNINSCDEIIVSHHGLNDYAWTLSLTVIVILVSWPYQFYSILLVTTDSWMAFLMFYLNLYNNFSIIVCEFQFIALCWIIQSRFADVNSRLEEMDTKDIFDGAEVIGKRIKQFKKATKLLVCAFYKLSALYSFPMLIILSGLTLNTLFGFYFTIFGTGFTRHSSKTSINFQKVSNIANDVIWSFYYFIRFVFVCMVAGLLTKKANTTKTFVCNLINSSLARNIKEELWGFLTYTTTNKLEFSACGFFKINRRLITSAVAMGTTYLVILAQFQSRRY